jgi:transposase
MQRALLLFMSMNQDLFNNHRLLMATPASFIVIDNAAFHKTPAVKTTIEAAGHVIQYLPVYSPHLNPIEKKWAQAKAIRRAYRCEIDELFSHHLI